MSEQMGVAILGCGYWGINYVRVFSELPETMVAVVCDARPERLAEVQRRFPGTPVTTEIDDALQRDDVTAVVVCTESTTHYDVTSRALRAGKHVLVEKPMTTVVEDGRKLIDLAEAQGVTLMVGHTFIYNTGIMKVKEYIAEHKVGQVYYLYARRTNLGPIRYDVNALWDLATHDISIFNYLLDEKPAWVSAVGSNILHNSREDVGFVAVGYPSGIIGHIHASWADPNKVREVVVVGNNMRILFDDVSSVERVRVFEKGVTPLGDEATNFAEYHLDIRDGDIISPKIPIAEPLKNQCLHFYDCIVNGKHPDTDGADGLAVVQTLTAIDRSMALRGAPVEIEYGE